MPITQRDLKDEKLLKLKIIKNIKTPRYNTNITNEVRSGVLLDISKGMPIRDIRDKYKIAMGTIISIKKKNKKVLKQIETSQVEGQLDIEMRIILQALRLLEKKIFRLENSDSLLDKAKATELSQMIKDIFTKMQLQQGQPTAITKQITDIDQAKSEIVAIAKRIERGDTTELYQAVFKKEGE